MDNGTWTAGKQNRTRMTKHIHGEKRTKTESGEHTPERGRGLTDNGNNTVEHIILKEQQKHIMTP